MAQPPSLVVCMDLYIKNLGCQFHQASETVLLHCQIAWNLCAPGRWEEGQHRLSLLELRRVSADARLTRPIAPFESRCPTCSVRSEPCY